MPSANRPPGYCLIAAIFLLATSVSATPGTSDFDWQNWSPSIFERARAADRLILLNLEAVWCHWCHVMDQRTYSDPRVIEQIQARYIAVRVDQDSHPELSNRYEDYGWPATIVLDGAGREIIKRRGYIGPQLFAWMLEAVATDPDPAAHGKPASKPRQSSSASLTPEQRETLEQRFSLVFDAEFGGWGRVDKFVHADSMEYALTRARGGSRLHEIMARHTLQSGRALLDPIWGGIYQYSDARDWGSPHYEKIMLSQSDNLRLYAQAARLLGEPDLLEVPISIHRYLTRFLAASEGGF